eukprot:Em0023g859a
MNELGNDALKLSMNSDIACSVDDLHVARPDEELPVEEENGDIDGDIPAEASETDDEINSNIDREIPAETSESDDEIETEEPPVDQGDHLQVVASVQWIKESLQQLKVCLKDAPLSHSNGATTVTRIAWHIDSISPLSLNAPGTQPPSVSDNNNLPVLDHLRCPLCFEILDQPLELSCNSIVCAKCLKAWLVESAKVECPCCFNHDHEPLAPSHIKTAPTLVLNLLNDVVIHCSLCSRDMKASGYQGHICELSPTQEEMRSASLILQRAASLSPEQPVLKFSTGGAVKLTVKQRCRELDAIRSIVSGGEPSALMQEELRMLSDKERNDLLEKSGISTQIEISAEQVFSSHIISNSIVP